MAEPCCSNKGADQSSHVSILLIRCLYTKALLFPTGFFSSLLIIFKINVFKINSRNTISVRAKQLGLRSGPTNVLVQTVWKWYQQKTLYVYWRTLITQHLLPVISFKRQLNVNFLCFDDVIMKWLLQSIHRGSNMSAHILLNSLNELWERDKMRGLPSILYLFSNEFNNSIIQEHEC